MSMPGEGGEDEAMSAINTTPLVDVMLVLLIIFLITIPVITQTVPVDLPKVANTPTKTKPENITICGQCGRAGVLESVAGAERSGLARPCARPSLSRIRSRRSTSAATAKRGSSTIGRTIYLIQRGGIIKVGFITEPDRGYCAPLAGFLRRIASWR